MTSILNNTPGGGEGRGAVEEEVWRGVEEKKKKERQRGRGKERVGGREEDER